MQRQWSDPARCDCASRTAICIKVGGKLGALTNMYHRYSVPTKNGSPGLNNSVCFTASRHLRLVVSRFLGKISFNEKISLTICSQVHKLYSKLRDYRRCFKSKKCCALRAIECKHVL